MVLAIDIANAAHDLCISILIPKGLSPKHEVVGHMDTSSLYAEKINEAGLGHLSGSAIIFSIMTVTGWDADSKWPGHPHPDLVIEYLKLPRVV